jgi:hypothetical protein
MPKAAAGLRALEQEILRGVGRWSPTDVDENLIGKPYHAYLSCARSALCYRHNVIEASVTIAS